ncbi:MAG: type secretion outer membrane protein, TolC family [Firmicutes bacterium]|nr:type secretion outer membrane protein, TolC family [Bacillota bacterium]
MNKKQNKQWIKNAAAAIMGVLMLWSTAFAAPPAPTELTLDQAVNMALTNNPSGKIAVFDFEAAKGTLTAARSYRWPTLSGNHKDTWAWAGETANARSTPPRDPNYISNQYSNSLTASWTLWSGNKVESQVSQAKLALDSSQWGIAAARQLLKYNATDAYFKFMAARDAVKLSQESVERLERYLQDVKLQFDVGVVAKVDVLRSEVELAKAKQTLIEWQNNFALTMANLNNIVGLPLTTELSIKGDMSYTIYEQDLATCVDAALRQRPEISQYTDAAKIAQEGITIAKAGYLPTVSAVYSAGWNDTNFAGGNNYNWTAYLTTSWTFLDSGLTAGTVKKAVEGFNKAKEQLIQTVDSVRLDVRSTYLSLKSYEQSIQTSSAAVGLAEEDYKIKVIRYQAGVGTNLDVLDAQVALTTAKNNYLQAMYNYNNYRAKLDKSMGVPVK